ncbi:MAG: endonuclease III [Bdellovibrionota bacterium]
MTDSLAKKAGTIYKRLAKLHPDAACELNFKTPLQLLVATILSAQCTDVRVNEVTKTLFREFKRPEDYVRKPAEELEKIIQSTGFFRQKAKSIRGAMQKIISEHGGQVPSSMEELVKLPGVGRKTANVVLGNAFDLPGLPVDTHVTRLSNRLGLTKQLDPVKIEADLNKQLPPKQWCMFSHYLIIHGRRICKARKPLCPQCPLTDICLYFKEHRDEYPAERRA